MAYTAATARTQVRSMLNETNAVFWSDTEIDNWIKEGCVVFSSGTLCVEADDDITLIANRLIYTSADHSWIADVVELYGAYYNDKSNNYAGMIKAHPRMLGHLDTYTAGDPKYIMLHNRSIYIWPLTTSAIVTATGVVSVLYAKETDDITALKDEFQIYPIMFASAKALQKDRRFSEANALMQQFNQMMGFERQDKHSREADSYDKFLISPTGGGPESSRG